MLVGRGIFVLAALVALTACAAADPMTPVAWDVLELVGRRVYFRAVDGLEEIAFAWIGWANVRLG